MRQTALPTTGSYSYSQCMQGLKTLEDPFRQGGELVDTQFT